MSKSIITVENVSKRYLLRHQVGKRGEGLRHLLERTLRNPWRTLQTRSGDVEEFWALRDASLDIAAGEVVGFIGRNGAGKSTLLKILSRITEPTTGRCRIRGRAASLLEVGTGFHPELTGRENIFLNGAILGMSRTEIKRKFDEIVDFAEVERFLDTPVKRYSSGMYVRLAFSVAAHLDADVLLIDEVLAVGDATFQKKCLEKMGSAAQSGRTVLFVSHNMQAVMRLCRRCVLLDRGRVALDGPASEVASAYLNGATGLNSVRTWDDLPSAPGDDIVRLCAVRVRSEDGAIADVSDIRNPIGVEIEYEVLKPGHVFHPHFGVRNEDGVQLFVAQDVDPMWRRRRRPPGRYVSTGWIPGNLLAEGPFSVHAVLMTLEPEHTHASVEDAVLFRVVDCLTATDTARGDYPRPIPGVLRPLLRWTTAYTPAGELAAVSQ